MEISKEEFEKAQIRLEEIIKLDKVGNDTPETDPLFQEMERVSDIIEAYEAKQPDLKELMDKVTDENFHEEIETDVRGNELI